MGQTTKEKLQGLHEQLDSRLEHVLNEDQTKNALVLPVLAALGWDVFDPSEVRPEHHLVIEGRTREAVDYALFIRGKVTVAIEVKSATAPLHKDHVAQLRGYFGASGAHIGVLTNGIDWSFYADLEGDRVMGSVPFAIFNLRNMTGGGVMASLERDVYRATDVLEHAKRTKDAASVNLLLQSLFSSDPPDWFVNDVIRFGLNRQCTDAARRHARPIIVEELTKFFDEANIEESPVPLALPA